MPVNELCCFTHALWCFFAVQCGMPIMVPPVNTWQSLQALAVGPELAPAGSLPAHISNDSNAVDLSTLSESVHRSSRSCSVRGPGSLRDSHATGPAHAHGSMPEVFSGDRTSWAVQSPLTAALACGHAGSYEPETGQRVLEHFQQVCSCYMSKHTKNVIPWHGTHLAACVHCSACSSFESAFVVPCVEGPTALASSAD